MKARESKPNRTRRCPLTPARFMSSRWKSDTRKVRTNNERKVCECFTWVSLQGERWDCSSSCLRHQEQHIILPLHDWMIAYPQIPESLTRADMKAADRWGTVSHWTTVQMQKSALDATSSHKVRTQNANSERNEWEETVSQHRGDSCSLTLKHEVRGSTHWPLTFTVNCRGCKEKTFYYSQLNSKHRNIQSSIRTRMQTLTVKQLRVERWTLLTLSGRHLSHIEEREGPVSTRFIAGSMIRTEPL